MYINHVKSAREKNRQNETRSFKTPFDKLLYETTAFYKAAIQKMRPEKISSLKTAETTMPLSPVKEKCGLDQRYIEGLGLEKLSFEDFCGRFHSEDCCVEILFKIRWPDGYCCPRCGHTRASEIRSRRLPLYECLNCHYQISIIKGTVMEGSRTSLSKWFQAIYLLACPHTSLNAVKLAAAISVTYKTAWLMLHKLRFVMSQADAGRPLEGTIRVNGAVYGRPHNPTIHRHKQEHPLLVGASVNQAGEVSRIKIKQLPPEHFSSTGILRCGTDHFVKQHISTTAASDIAIETRRYHLRGYQPLLICCKKASDWMNDVYHGIGPKHLQAYLNEFCFHMNHSLQNESPLNQLIQLSALTTTINYRTLVQENKFKLQQPINSSKAA